MLQSFSQFRPKMPAHVSNNVHIVPMWESKPDFISLTEFRWDKVISKVMTKFMRIWQGHTVSLTFFLLKIKKNNSNASRALILALD